MSLRIWWRAVLASLVVAASPGAAARGDIVPNILIWLPAISASGDALLADLAVLGEDAALATNLFAYSPDLAGHEIVMAVAGVEPNSHVITDAEGTALDTYVQNGGLLYLECADCFFFDIEIGNGYNVRPIFGLGTGDDGDTVFFGDIVGTGLFADRGFNFDYNGDSFFLDLLAPVTSVPLLRKAENDDIHGAFHASYGNGRSIAFSVEYGALFDLPDLSASRAPALQLTMRQELLAALLNLLRSGAPTAVPDTPAPPAVTLHPAEPNPFATGTTIRYDLPHAARVRLTVFDVGGHVVRTLADRREGPGSYSVHWDGRNRAGNPVSSGVYFFALDTGENPLPRRVVRRVVVLK